MADAPPPLAPKNLLSTILATFPTLCYSSTPRRGGLWVFWSSERHNPSIPETIQQKIRYALRIVIVHKFGGLIQFWAPVKTTSGRWLLTTSDQPFALANLDKGLHKYRLCSLKYQYNVDVNKVEVEDDPTIIRTGAPATAFLNQIPELLLDPKVHRMSPLVSSALECGLVYSFVLPVFHPTLNCCAGVIECSTSSSRELLKVFNELNTALESKGLITYHARERLPFKTICGLQHAKDEIDEALKIIWQTHGLGFAQVWIAYEDENHVTFSSSLEDNQTKRMLGLKLIGPYVGLYEEELEWYTRTFKSYSNACYRLPLKMGEGLIGKTFQNYESHFLKNISKSSINEPLWLLSFSIDCSCFVICLRSTKTGDLDYVFEFLWSESRNNVILFESLLLTLKRCLPSFKFPSGADLGDELCILDVENSTGSEIEYFKIFETKKSSPVSVTPKRGRRTEVEECLTPLKAKCKTAPIPLSREDIEPQFGKTMIEAAKDLKVSLSTLKRKCKVLGISEWQGKDYLKRNANSPYKKQSDTNEEEKGAAIQEPSLKTYLDEGGHFSLWT